MDDRGPAQRSRRSEAESLPADDPPDVVADLLDPPAAWRRAFDFVLESIRDVSDPGVRRWRAEYERLRS